MSNIVATFTVFGGYLNKVWLANLSEKDKKLINS